MAQNNLSYLYHLSLGVTQDYARERHFCDLAVEQGHALAQFNLGMMYELGQGIPVNKEKAQYFCELAAEQGNVATQRVLLSSFRKKDL